MTHPQPRVKTPVGDAPVVPMFLLAAGMYLAWFGVHYWRSDVKYPTDPVKAVLQGKPLPDPHGTPTADESAVLAAAQAQIAAQRGVTPGFGQSNPNAVGQAVASGAGGDVTGGFPVIEPGGAIGSSAAHNQAIGKLQAAAYGWSTGQQWDALVRLWTQESGWSNTAENPSSEAFGIPQALPYSKMPKAAWPTRHGGRADPTAQIQWGLAYIKGRYGSPLAAWAHEQTHNWY